MLIDQNNKCACCTLDFESVSRGRSRYPVVDHNHITGKVRALLCDRCNWNIGSFEADTGPDLLQKAVDYVKKHS